jgi:hypothetical protein
LLKNVGLFVQPAPLTYASATAEKIGCVFEGCGADLAGANPLGAAGFAAVAGEIARLVGLLDDKVDQDRRGREG